ncbi:methyl-accepting chemotaxis protein [Ideonella sp. DXS29W]|uniref:Methyl-accepting chemotaxis protein n=1 Tax=Ideonella lacteola TaxID=2984193 RepID=A0ABU9BJ29_9BURK
MQERVSTMVRAQWMDRVGSRLAVGFGLLIVLMVLLSGYGIRTLFQTTSTLDRLSQHEWKTAQLASELKALVELNGLRIAASARMGASDYATQILADYDAAKKSMTTVDAALREAIEDPDLKSAYDGLAAKASRLDGLVVKVRQFQSDSDFVSLETLLQGDFNSANKEYTGSVVALQRLAQEHADAAAQAAQAATRAAAVVTVSLVAVGVLFAATFGWRLGLSIARPVRAAAQQARAIAQGDLSVAVTRDSGGEIGDLQTAISEMQGGLRHLVGQVQLASDSIANGSTEIATGNQDLSDRTERTSANVQRTSATMNTLSTNLSDTTQAATQASALASQATDIAKRGGQVVAQVVETMGEIHTASNKISEITGVIDGIAFQTNILALNAAVEAARAGEQGRGFAVVASEVRSLAQRSAEAAKEIKGLIGASSSRVEAGTRLVEQAGETMNEMVSSSERVSQIVVDISSRMSVQMGHVEEVSSSMHTLDEASQQNSALVEQSAAAAESLRQNAIDLRAQVEKFRLAP